ncbi:MAG: hypothetical protein M3077_00565, partial [Candidatus Dormibacteraeota bacterium]|nr:hypothetical protein [Candidatus Dormibacteraeota bacterium]
EYGVLMPHDGSRRTEFDVIELGVVAWLRKEIGLRDSRKAWRSIRSRLLERPPVDTLHVVWEDQDGVAVACYDEAEVKRAVDHGRMVRVFNLTAEISRVRAAFRTEVEDSKPRPPIRRRDENSKATKKDSKE